jgi:hypothetical protein
MSFLRLKNGDINVKFVMLCYNIYLFIFSKKHNINIYSILLYTNISFFILIFDLNKEKKITKFAFCFEFYLNKFKLTLFKYIWVNPFENARNDKFSR